MGRMDWRVSTFEAVRSLPQDKLRYRTAEIQTSKSGFDRLASRVARNALLQTMPWLRVGAASSPWVFLGGRGIRFEMAFAESKAAKGQKS
jgi:hypothetical protein